MGLGARLILEDALQQRSTAQKRWRYAIRQPNAVRGTLERVTRFVHTQRGNAQNHRLSVPRADALRSFLIG